MTPLIVGNVYNFETLAPSILPTHFKNAKLEAELSFDMANTLDNVGLRYRQIFPILPPGSLDDPTKQKWYAFKTELNEKAYLCGQWINASTVTLVKNISLTIFVTNLNVGDDEKIRSLLVAAGFNSFSIS